ncbi:MAG: hypothetical protein K1X89_03910 [Myxococcaceae bacterium]|nr:hypothetical protein [Myxococcaceae bacterium]
MARLLPRLLAPDPAKAVLGVTLAAQLKPMLSEGHAEDTIPATLSAMVRELSPVIAKVPGSHGYYLLNTTEVSRAHQQESLADELTQPERDPRRKPFPQENYSPYDAVTGPAPIQLQVRAALLEAMGRDEKTATPYSELLQQLRERLPTLKWNTLKVYFSRLVQEKDSGVVKTPDGRLYLGTPQRGASQRVDREQRRPDPEDVLTRKVRAMDELLDAGDDPALGIPSGLIDALHTEELFALRVLARVGSCRSTDLAERLGRPVGRIGGMMRTLRRKLHALGLELFVAEVLLDGETQFRFVMKKESH